MVQEHLAHEQDLFPRQIDLEIAAGVRTGTYGINMYTLDIGAPFGGFKQSGYGRELGPHALEAYTEIKTIFYATEGT